MAEEHTEYRGEVTQGDTPTWEPLLATVGEELTGDFMWMFEVRLSNGALIQAYKHIDTRGYLHLGADGSAFVYLSEQTYRQVPVGELVLRVIAPRAAHTYRGVS